MANLWITGDSWGVLDKELPHTHWVNFYKEHYGLKNIYCLARQGIAQDMINYITHSVIRNTKWTGRTENWSTYDDHLIVFPTTPTRISFKSVPEKPFDVTQGPLNLNWDTAAHTTSQPHPWHMEDSTGSMESENFVSLHADNNPHTKSIVEYSVRHPDEFCDWRDKNHLKHIVREVQCCNIYGCGDRMPRYHQVFPGEEPRANEQVNHLNERQHTKYWNKIKELL